MGCEKQLSIRLPALHTITVVRHDYDFVIYIVKGLEGGSNMRSAPTLLLFPPILLQRIPTGMKRLLPRFAVNGMDQMGIQRGVLPVSEK